MAGQDSIFGSAVRYRLFTAVKYTVYLLLCINIFLFLLEELQSLEFTYGDTLALGDVVQVFAATIDTAAWVILLLLFELETAVLDDRQLTGLTRWTIHGIRLLCSAAIVYAFTGYCAELAFLYEVAELDGTGACGWVGRDYSVLVKIDTYEALSAANCAPLADGAYQFVGFEILSTPETLRVARWLGWTDVINAAAWILVVVVLEVEVRLQLRGALTNAVMRSTLVIKYLLYATLFAAALYWGYAGDFIDVWDAALWLFAFIFIELNVFEWQFETSQAQPIPG
jgi:hypothetical protein